MIIFDTSVLLSRAKLPVGDVVMIMGENKIGDSSVRFGVVREGSFSTPNQRIPISDGKFVEVLPR